MAHLRVKVRRKRHRPLRRRRIVRRRRGAPGRSIRAYRRRFSHRRPAGGVRHPAPDPGLGQRAFEAGRRAAHNSGEDPNIGLLKQINQCWNEWRSAHHLTGLPWNAYHEVSAKFAAGFQQERGSRLHAPVLVTTTKTIGVVITAMNEERAIASVLEQLARLPLDETVIVVNGSTDQTFAKVRSCTGGIVLHFVHPLGHDVGRAVGAKQTNADIVLFLDGDFPINAEHFVPFIDAVANGMDVALNDITPYIDVFANRDPVTIVKELLNRALERTDLAANSMTAVPHALSRKALETIGCSNLVVPPKAQAIAIRSGLRVGQAMSVDVISKNRVRDKNSGIDNPVSHMIVGDHLEAFELIMRSDGARLKMSDKIRNRSALGRAST